MRKVTTVWLLACATALGIGCQQASGPVGPKKTASAEGTVVGGTTDGNGTEAVADTAEGVLVTLNVPNMT